MLPKPRTWSFSKSDWSATSGELVLMFVVKGSVKKVGIIFLFSDCLVRKFNVKVWAFLEVPWLFKLYCTVTLFTARKLETGIILPKSVTSRVKDNTDCWCNEQRFVGFFYLFGALSQHNKRKKKKERMMGLLIRRYICHFRYDICWSRVVKTRWSTTAWQHKDLSFQFRELTAWKN